MGLARLGRSLSAAYLNVRITVNLLILQSSQDALVHGSGSWRLNSSDAKIHLVAYAHA